MDMTMAMGMGGTIAFICMLWVLYEVWAVNESISTGKKILWSLSALFFNVITAIVYYFIEKRDQLA